MGRQIEADARAGATRTFADQEEATQFLMSLSPRGFRPRPEYFVGILDQETPEKLGPAFAEYAKTHPDEFNRAFDAMMARVRPAIEALLSHIQAQFRSGAPSDRTSAADVLPTLAAAQRDGRRAVLVFCATWSGACPRVERALADPSVAHAMADRFVTIRVDCTDDDRDSAVAQLEQHFHVQGTPTLVVLDAAGREVARATEALDAPKLLDLLSRAP
jgi:hypothetical protein